MRAHFLHVTLLALAAAGCGSRSGTLSDDLPTATGGAAGVGTGGSGAFGGSGGSGAFGGSGGSGAFGGTGGSTAFCPDFDLTGSAIEFTPASDLLRRAPSFSAVAGSPDLVAVVSPEIPSESSGPGPAAHHLRMTTLAPWGGWTTTLGAGAESAFVVGVDQFAMDAGDSVGKLAMAWPSEPSPPASQPQGLFFSSKVAANSGNFNQVGSLALAGFPSHVARFVSAGAGAHLVGFETVGFDHAFHVSYVAGSDVSQNTHVGCASSPITGDAIPMPGGGFMFAFSTSRQWGSCLDDFGINGPADKILAGVVGGPGGGFGPLPVKIEVGFDQVEFVRLLPAPGGAWLVYRYAGTTSSEQPPIMLLRLDTGGAPLGEPVPVLHNSFYGVPGLASLGERVAVALTDPNDSMGTTFAIYVVNAAGTTLHQRSYQPSKAFAEPRVGLMASPAHDQLLLGWSAPSPDSGVLAARVARFCVPGP